MVFLNLKKFDTIDTYIVFLFLYSFNVKKSYKIYFQNKFFCLFHPHYEYHYLNTNHNILFFLIFLSINVNNLCFFSNFLKNFIIKRIKKIFTNSKFRIFQIHEIENYSNFKKFSLINFFFIKFIDNYFIEKFS